MTTISNDMPDDVKAAIALVKQWGFAVLHRDHIMTAKAQAEVSPEMLHRIDNKLSFAEHITRQLAVQVADFLLFNHAASFKDSTATVDDKKRRNFGVSPIGFTATVDVIKPNGFYLDFPALGLGKRAAFEAKERT